MTSNSIQEQPPEKIGFKKKIVDAGVVLQGEVIEDLKKSIEEMTALEEKIGDQESGSYQRCFKKEAISEIRLFQEMLELAKRELLELMLIQSYPKEAPTRVEYGTIVNTDKAILFVAAAVKQHYVAGFSVLGISVNNPIYSTMKGKRCGDSFAYNDVVYLIKEIF
jgi:hypothetical protein